MPKKFDNTVFIEYAKGRIEVAIGFRKRKRMSISVHPNGSVTAIAPEDRPLDDVLAQLRRRRLWIARQLRYFEKYQPLPLEKCYVSGETHLYLGRQYRLRVHHSDQRAVKLVGKFLNAYVPAPAEPQDVKVALDAWYLSHAAPIFRECMNQCLKTAASLRLTEIPLRIRPMRNRWGSCSKAGTITLNADLIKTPLYCIEYVIMHELCHLRVHDHSPAFFRLLHRYMPDWEKRKNRLELVVLR